MVKRQTALFMAAFSLCLLVGSAFQVVAPGVSILTWASGVLGLLVGLALVIADRKRSVSSYPIS